MLTDIVPAKYRRLVYSLYALAVVVVGALNAAEVATGKATDVLTYLGGALGVVAAANTSPPRTRNDDEAGASTVEVIVLLTAGIFLGFVLDGRL